MNISNINPPFLPLNQVDNYDKGRFFEEYVISLFNEKNFTLVNWRKATNPANHQLPGNYGDPDLEMIFSGRNKYRFAVECKWQSYFNEGKIKWATDIKINRYLAFQNKMGIPVFIAIGIGGHPFNPDKLFVTPLSNICMHIEVFESDLIPYKRKPTRRFFYDTVQLKLW